MNNTNKSLPLRYWLSVASLMLSCICKSHAATLQVPANYPTIQAAVDAAKDGDTIELEAGRRFEEPIVVGNWPTWTKNIKLIGSGTSGNRPVIAGSLKTLIMVVGFLLKTFALKTLFILGFQATQCFLIASF